VAGPDNAATIDQPKVYFLSKDIFSAVLLITCLGFLIFGIFAPWVTIDHQGEQYSFDWKGRPMDEDSEDYVEDSKSPFNDLPEVQDGWTSHIWVVGGLIFTMLLLLFLVLLSMFPTWSPSMPLSALPLISYILRLGVILGCGITSFGTSQVIGNYTVMANASASEAVFTNTYPMALMIFLLILIIYNLVRSFGDLNLMINCRPHRHTKEEEAKLSNYSKRLRGITLAMVVVTLLSLLILQMFPVFEIEPSEDDDFYKPTSVDYENLGSRTWGLEKEWQEKIDLLKGDILGLRAAFFSMFFLAIIASVGVGFITADITPSLGRFFIFISWLMMFGAILAAFLTYLTWNDVRSLAGIFDEDTVFRFTFYQIPVSVIALGIIFGIYFKLTFKETISGLGNSWRKIKRMGHPHSPPPQKRPSVEVVPTKKPEPKQTSPPPTVEIEKNEEAELPPPPPWMG
jgi:MFS family permease